MAPDNKENLRHNLALDKLGEEQAEEVTTFFMTSPEAKELQDSKNESLRKRVEGKMSVLQTMKDNTTGIIMELAKQILEEARSKYVYESFTDANGVEHNGGYTALFNSVLDEVGVDLEGTDEDKNNPVRKKAESVVSAVLLAVPVNLRAKYMHQYAEEMIRDFVKKMDDQAETLTFGTLHVEEVTKLKPLSFQEWIAAPERARLTDLFMELDQEQARKFTGDVAKIREVLAYVKGITGLNNDLLEYFTGEAKKMEGSITTNPAEILKKVGDLEAAAKASVALAAVQTAVESSLTEASAVKAQVQDFDATIETGYAKLKVDIEKGFTDFLVSKDVKLLDKSGFESTKTQLDTKLAAEKAKVQATVVPPAPGKPNENDPSNPNNPPAEEKKKWSYADIINDPGGWIMNKLPWLAVVFAFVPKLQAQFSALISKVSGKKAPEQENKEPDKPKSETDTTAAAAPLVAAAPGAASSQAPETAETPQQKAARETLERREAAIDKSTKYIKEKINFTEDEMKLVTPMKVTDFLKLQDAPVGIEKTKFAALKQSLSFNGATSENTETIIEFVASKGENWKEPLVAGTATNPPSSPINPPANPQNPPATTAT